MKRSDLTILGGIALLGLVAAFWLLILSPKRDRASELETKVDELSASVEEQEQIAAYAEEAKDDFDTNYRRVVVLGKAVPEDSDTPSLLVQVQHLADLADVDFRKFELHAASGSSTPPPPAAETEADTSTASSESGTTSSGDTSSSSTSTSSTTSSETSSTVPGGQDDASSPAPATATASSAAPAPATEASAASVPIGAVVGPAGLPTMPYAMSFNGGFFEVASFLDRLDSLVHSRSSQVAVEGRLLTIDGFTLSPDPVKGFPALSASLAITTYVTPASQGLTAGATPTGPAPATAPSVSPVPTAATTTP
jgi:hypothetical protein